MSVDEKTQIQALERTQLPLPLREGRARRHTHDYKRHGVVDLYAALNVANGEVTHRCTDSHTAKDFLRFMKHVARRHPRQELHVVLDNSSTHGTAEVKEWLAKNPRVHFHYTPTSASWLNQVEGFFGISESSRSPSRTFRARARSASTSTRTSGIGTTTRLPSSGRNPPLRSSARGSECLIGSHMHHRTARQDVNVGAHQARGLKVCRRRRSGEHQKRVEAVDGAHQVGVEGFVPLAEHERPQRTQIDLSA
jgi:transposase